MTIAPCMPLLTLLHRLIVRPLWRERLRTTLLVLAVALGTGVVVAIDLAGQAAAGSFRSSMESLTGSADLEVSAIGGLDEHVLGQLASLPYPLRLRPRMEEFGLLNRTGQTVPVIGLDLVAVGLEALAEGVAVEGTPQDAREALDQLGRPDSVWIGRRLAASIGVQTGGRVRLTLQDRTADYVVRGLLASRSGEEELVVMDVAAAQLAMARPGRLDRIEIDLPPDADATDWEARLRPHLPTSAQLRPRGARSDETRKMLGAFRWNLRILSYIALIVGAFLIYNAVSISVVRRRPEIGIVRALGMGRRTVLAGFLAEAGLLGLAGSLLGLALGRVMALAAVRLIGVTVEALYVTSRPAPIELTPLSAITGLSVGLGTALLAALAPAREAAKVAPVEAMARGRQEFVARLRVRRHLLVAFALGLASAVLSQLPPVGGKPLAGYASAALLLAATALAIPAVVTAGSHLLPPLVQRLFGVEASLAYRSLQASLGRTSVLVGALATAVAMMTSVGVMVGSFRQTVVLWMDNQLKADFYLRPAGSPAADRQPTLRPEVADRIERLPGVAAVDRFRLYPISFRGLPASLAGGETKTIRRFGSTAFLSGGDTSRILTRLGEGDFVVVSEPFANKHGVSTGDRIRLPLGDRERPFEVLGVYRDYSNERGTIIMDRRTLLAYLPDPAPTNLAVYLTPGADPESVRTSIERAIAGHSVLLFAHGTLRRDAIAIFDRTFAITYALELVAIVVAVIGIAGSLLALLIDRRREFALLRFLGASAGQVRRLVLFEAGFLGLLAHGVGLCLGALLSLLLVFVINRQSFGWTIDLHWPVRLLCIALSGVFAATVLAGLSPARMAMRLNPIEVIHEE